MGTIARPVDDGRLALRYLVTEPLIAGRGVGGSFKNGAQSEIEKVLRIRGFGNSEIELLRIEERGAVMGTYPPPYDVLANHSRP